LLTIPDHISWQNVEHELALFDLRDGSYHALNGSAAAIWRGIAAGKAPEAIADELAALHAADAATVARDLRAFVEAALAKGLLVEAPSA
jgi:hypothetical protein